MRLEDVMLPSDDPMSGFQQQQMSNGSLFATEQFENKGQVQHIENGLFQRYPSPNPNAQLFLPLCSGGISRVGC